MSEEKTANSNDAESEKSPATERKKSPLELKKEAQARMRGQQAGSSHTQSDAEKAAQGGGPKKVLFQRKAG